MIGRSTEIAASTDRSSPLNNVERMFTPITDENLPLWEFDYNFALFPEAIDAGSLRDYKEHLWTKAILVEMYVICDAGLKNESGLYKRLLLS